MKRVLGVILALVFFAGISVPVVQAAPHKAYYPFKDIKGYWAEKMLCEMNAKGYVRGYTDATFKPSNVVSKIEAVVMMVRLLDLEKEAKQTTLTAPFAHAKQIPAWARGYVQVAYDKGILTAQDLKSFRPKQGAKRLEVAAMIAQGLNLEQSTSLCLTLTFNDVKDLPRDWQSVIVVMVQNGIMKGTPGNHFLPHKPITRAEMAVLLDRIDGRAGINLREVRGILVNIADNDVTLKKGNITRIFKLDDKVTVYLDGKTAELAELEPGMRLKLVFGDTEKIVLIEAETVEQEQTYQGKITQIVLGNSPQISVEYEGKDYQFNINDNTVIEKDGKEVFLTELTIGIPATIIAKGDLALTVTVGEESKQSSYEGKIVSLVLGNDSVAVIKIENKKEYTFRITKDTEIKIDNESAELKDLQIGDQVNLLVDDQVAVTIMVERP